MTESIKNTTLIIFIFVFTNILCAQYRIISLEKNVFEYKDSVLVDKGLFKYDCIFEIDTTINVLTYITQNGYTSFFIDSIQNTDHKFTYFLTNDYKKYRVLVDLDNEFVKTIINGDNGVYLTNFNIARIEILNRYKK
jgi:hypothetical protein